MKIRNEYNPPNKIDVIHETIKDDGTSIPFFILGLIICISIIVKIINLYA